MTLDEKIQQAAEKEFSWHEVNSIDEMKEFYLSVLPKIRESAKNCGYAIGLHGSLVRDFDLIAVPWIKDHSTLEVLAQQIQLAACGLKQKKYQWESKPCGRVATSFPVCFNMFHVDGVKGLGHIDLSIMPEVTKSELMPLLEKALEALDWYAIHDQKMESDYARSYIWLRAKATAQDIREALK